eukprot:GSChrysophyteH2.ASY1.ANO1.1643.1 assembled CDS
MWEGAYEDDTHMKKPVDEHIQKTLTFVQEHEVILRTIEEATRNAIAEAPETHYRAIRVVAETPERVLPQDLIDSDHELLRKVVSVLIFLCDEVHDLADIAENKMYKPLEMFGQTPPLVESDAGSDREKMIGHFLPLLQDLSNFIDRCYVVASNIVQQLASLLKPKEHLYKTCFKDTHLTPCFSALGEVLSILITLDSIIDGNDAIKECWGYYKTMISFVRNDPEQFNTDEAALVKFEKMLVSIDQAVVVSEIFKGCIEQNFETYVEDRDEYHVNVRGNELFFQEMLYCLRMETDNALKIIGTGAEMFERKKIVASLASYALYRKLLPANIQPDPKLHKYLWEVQRVVPVVILADTVMFTPGEFLNAYAFYEIKKPEPVNPAAFRRQFIQQFDSQIDTKTSILMSQTHAWLVLAESRIQPCLRHEKNVDQALDVRASILLKGLSLANRANSLTKQCLIMHSNMQVPMNKGALLNIVSRLVTLASFTNNIKLVTDTSFLYFHLDILSPMVTALYALQTEVNRLQYVIGAFADGIKMCAAVTHSDPTPFFVNYRSFIKEVIAKHIIQPLCRDIENNLRIHISTKNLEHLETVNPKASNLTPLRPFLDMPPLRVLGLIIDIHQEVKHYLDTNFYNLTTISLHDWRTYADMRSLAAEKLGFTYNMNMQQFVEFRPDKSSKHLNTIRIQSIAASIRQHGLGVLNTTVNYTYQFLAQKFHIYSQFLFDDYIGAHLGREHRWFKKHRHDKEIGNMYPYERAMKFVKDIRKLGVNSSGKSFLDQFRILITEIGNALGYVRMVRSASMFFCSEAVQYLPDFENVISFEEHAGKGTPGAGLGDETVRAGRNLDEVIDTLVKNFGEGSDYFKVLVNVFQKNFYLIVPSLCISWVEASLQAKDCMYKATRGVVREMYYTDDGFPVGVAYCLAILKQTRKFEALHWVDTVRTKYKEDSRKIAEQEAARDAREAQKKAKREEKEKKSRSWFSLEEDYEEQEANYTLQVSAKRLEAHRRETEQLFYCLSGAGIFFKRTDVEVD